MFHLMKVPVQEIWSQIYDLKIPLQRAGGDLEMTESIIFWDPAFTRLPHVTPSTAIWGSFDIILPNCDRFQYYSGGLKIIVVSIRSMESSLEEREMEVEALQSIYGEQFTVMVDSQPVSYEVKLQQTKTKIIFTIPGKIISPILVILQLKLNTSE